MEWVQSLNKTMKYIEEHLTEEIGYDELAKIACCSTYHFQRMFSYMAEVPLAQYIRRRRMSLAAVELQTTNQKIVDIALKYGYQSPTAFTRAFQSIHGIAPSDVRSDSVSLNAFPPLHFTISIKGAEKMNYRIEEKEELRIIGISELMSKNLEDNFAVVPQLWERFAAEQTFKKLAPIMNGEIMGVLGISACQKEENWRYFIAVASSSEIPDGMEELIISPFTWAVFPGTGVMPHAIQDLEKRIVTEWLPTSGYEYADGPDIEVYMNQDPAEAIFEVWIPVVKGI